MPVTICPHLGLTDDESVSRTVLSESHRCYARRPAAVVDAATQTAYCLSGRYVACQYCPKASRSATPLTPAVLASAASVQEWPLELPPAKWATISSQPAVTTPTQTGEQQPAPRKSYAGAPTPTASEPAWGAAHSAHSAATAHIAAEQAEHDGASRRGLSWLWLVLPAAAIVAFVALLLAIGNEWLRPPVADSSVPQAAQTPTITPAPTGTLNPAATPFPTPPPAVQAGTEVPQLERFVTATPVEGGKVVTLGPSAGVAGWWSSKEQRGRLGDSFLYAGRYEGQDFLSAARFDLLSIPRGAALQQVLLRLSGLSADRLAAASDTQDAGSDDTIWLVQLVGESAAPDLERGDYLTTLSAPAAITLPPLRADMLAAGKVNTFELDDASRAWLAQQLLDGATSVVVRFIASGGTGDTLFAWDSGQGPESEGNWPMLVVSYGPPPPTPPPLPTKPFVVATLTPIPANALTVVAQAATATTQAALVGTATELPYQVYTPTPFPENLETVQAAAAINGLPAVLLLTPTPANAATATEQFAYATAVALTTGTFTPVPTGFVTPIVVPPSPPAQNVATAAARAVAATVAALAPPDGLLPTATATSLPFNAVLGVYVYATPVFIPTNEATAVAYYKQINDAILATGTPTPLPWNAIIITTVPTPVPPTLTPIPLFIPSTDFTPTPTPAATSAAPSELPAEVRGKILFRSDRGGAEAIYMLDPATGDVTLITQPWVYDLAQVRLPLSADGTNRALVRRDDRGMLQIYNESTQYGTVSKVTALGATNYDPTWSPTGEWIAFVSTETGGDEIYRVDPSGAVAQRLTVNTWEWDKHPSWSPDGSQIVFYSNREGGRRQLWVMDVDGANQRNLSSNEYNDWDPIWIR